MRISILLFALCSLMISCREEKASTSAPDSPAPATSEESEKTKDSEEPQETKAQPKEEITVQQLRDLGSFLF